MVEKEKIFLSVERQLIKVKEVAKLENHHVATIIITDSGKYH